MEESQLISLLIPLWFQIMIIPLIILGLWALLFYTSNFQLPKLLISGGYLFIVIPVLVMISLTIPLMVVCLYLVNLGNSQNIMLTFTVLTVLSVLFIDSKYLIKVKNEIEEREQMPIMSVIKRDLGKNGRIARDQRYMKSKIEIDQFYSQIIRMNNIKRKLRDEELDNFRKGLFTELD